MTNTSKRTGKYCVTVCVGLAVVLLSSVAQAQYPNPLYIGSEDVAYANCVLLQSEQTAVDIILLTDGVLEIKGGTVEGTIKVLYASSSVIVHGTGFKWNGSDIVGDSQPIGSGGTLTGTYGDTLFSLLFGSSPGVITLVEMGGGAAPVIEAITIPPTELGSPTTVTAVFTDSDGGTHTATIDWGDDTVDTDLPVTGGTVVRTHTYAAAGDAYEVTVTVTDDGLQSASGTAYAVVYEPSRGVAVGAGWIPEVSAPCGKAFFGFVCRSVWWSDSPWGGLGLTVGDMRFRSTQYDWLWIVDDAAGIAWFAGWGTINGEGDYYFMVETSGDSIWITIYDEYDTGDLVNLGDGWIGIREW